MWYEILEPISEGGFCIVYRAKAVGDEGFEKFVAVKVLKPEFVGNRFFEDKLEREAKLLARIYHPGVAQVFDFVRIEDRPACVLEWIDGPTVAQAAKQATTTERCQLARKLIREVAQTLLDLSNRLGGVFVHGDLSPRNIVFATGSGMPRLIDFGEAFFRNQSSNPAPNQNPQQIFATPNFAAPELTQTGPTVATDIYALGKTAEVLCPEPEESLREVLTLMTEPDVKNRLTSWEEVLERLDAKASRTAIDKGRPSMTTVPLSPEDELSTQPAYNRLSWKTIAALLIVAVVLIFGILAYQHSKEKSLPKLIQASAVIPSISTSTNRLTAAVYLWGLANRQVKLSIDGNPQKLPRSGIIEVPAGCHRFEINLNQQKRFERLLCLPPSEVQTLRVRF